MAVNDNSSLRIILVGKTGAGKSSTGNTILRREEFHADISGNAVTRVCKKFTETIENTRISVIDTPGFCGSLSNKDMKEQLQECVELSGPGPRAFLLVIQVGRFTQEEQNAVKFIKKNFGEKAINYTIVVFTYADLLKKKPLQTYIEETKGLRELIESCNNRYHALNNNDVANSLQVTQLLQMIQKMVKENGRSHYTNEMFNKAQKEVKTQEFLSKAKDAASVTGLVVAGGVAVGLAGAGVGAAIGAVVAKTVVAAGTGIGAEVGGVAGGVIGGVAGGVIGAKSEETETLEIENKKND